jgi:hypothetical protein
MLRCEQRLTTIDHTELSLAVAVVRHTHSLFAIAENQSAPITSRMLRAIHVLVAFLLAPRYSDLEVVAFMIGFLRRRLHLQGRQISATHLAGHTFIDQ